MQVCLCVCVCVYVCACVRVRACIRACVRACMVVYLCPSPLSLQRKGQEISWKWIEKLYLMETSTTTPGVHEDVPQADP